MTLNGSGVDATLGDRTTLPDHTHSKLKANLQSEITECTRNALEDSFIYYSES